MERTFEIEDASGKRTLTLAQYRAELDARKAMAQHVMDAARRGDLEGCGKAQAAIRAKFK